MRKPLMVSPNAEAKPWIAPPTDRLRFQPWGLLIADWKSKNHVGGALAVPRCATSTQPTFAEFRVRRLIDPSPLNWRIFALGPRSPSSAFA